jgi:hypothetical protein
MTPLLLQRISYQQFMLMEDFHAECGITVPMGFISDGITVPRGLRWFAVPTGCGFNAALVHDYLLSEGHSWEHAQERFEAQLELDGIPYITRKLYVFGVAIWGKIR